MLAAGRKELRDAIAEIVKTARGNGWTNADKAEGWLEELEERGTHSRGAGRSTRGLCVAARLRSVSPPQAPTTQSVRRRDLDR